MSRIDERENKTTYLFVDDNKEYEFGSFDVCLNAAYSIRPRSISKDIRIYSFRKRLKEYELKAIVTDKETTAFYDRNLWESVSIPGNIKRADQPTQTYLIRQSLPCNDKELEINNS